MSSRAAGLISHHALFCGSDAQKDKTVQQVPCVKLCRQLLPLACLCGILQLCWMFHVLPDCHLWEWGVWGEAAGTTVLLGWARMHTCKGRWCLGCIPACSSDFTSVLFLFGETAKILVNAIIKPSIRVLLSETCFSEAPSLAPSLPLLLLWVLTTLRCLTHSLASYGWHIRFLTIYCSGR